MSSEIFRPVDRLAAYLAGEGIGLSYNRGSKAGPAVIPFAMVLDSYELLSGAAQREALAGAVMGLFCSLADGDGGAADLAVCTLALLSVVYDPFGALQAGGAAPGEVFAACGAADPAGVYGGLLPILLAWLSAAGLEDQTVIFLNASAAWVKDALINAARQYVGAALAL